jgi:hypothetical protein
MNVLIVVLQCVESTIMFVINVDHVIEKYLKVSLRVNIANFGIKFNP